MSTIKDITYKAIYKRWRNLRDIQPKDVVCRKVMDFATKKHAFPVTEEDAKKMMRFFEQQVPNDAHNELTDELLQQLRTHMNQS